VRLFGEAKAAGYVGDYTQLRAYIKEIRPRPSVEPVVRFETPPGRQAQVDFGKFRLPWGMRKLPAGRAELLAGALDDGAFLFFGGVPEEIPFDHSPGRGTACACPGAGKTRCER
jgi:transposase